MSTTQRNGRRDFNAGLADYVEVPERIRLFFERYPEGSLVRKEWHMEPVGERLFVVYTAAAYRTPDDKRPGVGTAWEPFPGTTPYTKNSELMNAETSAWGRALVALGFVGKKIASAEEVRNRKDDPAPLPESLRDELLGLVKQALDSGAWDAGDLSKHLVAAGARDTSGVRAAVESLTPDGAEELKRGLVDALAAGSPA